MTSHGQARRGQKTDEYLIWVSMRQRCNNSKNKKFSYYGGRGIAVCERWKSFANFFADMGMRPTQNHSIDRKNNRGNYEPSNCRWATASEQANNTKRNIFVVVAGERMPISKACQLLGLKYGTAISRIHRGQSPQQAIRNV